MKSHDHDSTIKFFMFFLPSPPRGEGLRVRGKGFIPLNAELSGLRQGPLPPHPRPLSPRGEGRKNKKFETLKVLSRSRLMSLFRLPGFPCLGGFGFGGCIGGELRAEILTR